MNIGEIEILPVIDGRAWFDAAVTYATHASADAKGAHDADWTPHRDLLDSEGRLEMVFGGYLVRTADRVMLVDVGLGTRTRAGDMPGAATLASGELIENLGGYGLGPGDITDVVFTHLHFDHVGWASQKGEITFPNATYRCHERDWDHFVGSDTTITRKLTPVTDRLELFDHDHTIAPGVDVRLATGHTPGSVLVVLSSGADRALLIGDVVHCPVELMDDDWAGLADVDPRLARETRNALARELEGTDTPIGAAHFPGLEFGRLLPGQGRRHWVVG